MEATVNLILPLAVTVRIDPQPSSIVHLNEFGIQILAGLSDGRDENNISSVYAAQSLAGFKRDEISNAIKDLAIESASELAANLLPRVESKLQVTPEPTEPVSAAAKAEEAAKDVAKVLDSSSQPTEAAEQQVRDYLGGFIDKNLGKFYGGNTSKVEELATQAVSKAKDVAAEFQIPTNSALRVAELALYNFIILCGEYHLSLFLYRINHEQRLLADFPADDSGSMNANDAHLSGSNSALNRIPAMKDAVLRFFNIATAVNPEQGIHLRFFDSPQISQTDGDKLTSEAIVTQTLDQCCFDTGWGVPQPLQQKILLPLLEKAKKDELTAPTVVIIITDGGVCEICLVN